MELTELKTLPEELIRHIMTFLRCEAGTSDRDFINELHLTLLHDLRLACEPYVTKYGVRYFYRSILSEYFCDLKYRHRSEMKLLLLTV